MPKNMLKSFLLAALMIGGASLARADYSEAERQALQLTSKAIQADLAKSGLPSGLPIAVLPIRGKGDSSGYVLSLLKNAITGAGLNCVEGKEDDQVQEIFKEVEWDERKDDILDTNTIAKFGQLQAAKLLLYAFVNEVSDENGRGYADISYHVDNIQTKQHLWSGDIARRFYTPNQPDGPVDLSPEIRQAIKASFGKLAAGLRADGKLNGVNSVLIVPLAGDQDQFVTGLVVDNLSSTPYSPKQLDVRTLADARALLRDDPKAAGAILYGAVRDLSMRKMNDYADHTEYQINTSVQLAIQTSPDGNILWSDTVDTSTPYILKQTTWEMVQQYGPMVLARKWYVIVPLIAVAGLFVLVILMWMMRRSR
jgi:hypothetical protein